MCEQYLTKWCCLIQLSKPPCINRAQENANSYLIFDSFKDLNQSSKFETTTLNTRGKGRILLNWFTSQFLLKKNAESCQEKPKFIFVYVCQWTGIIHSQFVIYASACRQWSIQNLNTVSKEGDITHIFKNVQIFLYFDT